MTAMLTLILSCVLLLFGCADRNLSEDSRLGTGIIQGEPVENTVPDAQSEQQKSNAFIAKHTVMLAFNFEIKNGVPNFFGVCSGTVVNSRTILTAAHCLEDGLDNIKVLHSVDPRKTLSKDSDVYSIIDKKIHPKYIPKKTLAEMVKSFSSDNDKARALTRSSDIALIYLDRPLKTQIAFSAVDYKNPLDIDKKSAQTEITITGYGRTSILKDASDKSFDQLNGVLQKGKLSVLTTQFSRSGFFLRQWSSAGICKGDSGGPVFSKNKQDELRVVALAVTVYSFNNKTERALDPENEYNVCASHGLYLNIEQYKPWIAKNLFKEKTQP